MQMLNIEITTEPLALSALLVLSIAAATVATQAFRAANANPIDVLRVE